MQLSIATIRWTNGHEHEHLDLDSLKMMAAGSEPPPKDTNRQHKMTVLLEKSQEEPKNKVSTKPSE